MAALRKIDGKTGVVTTIFGLLGVEEEISFAPLKYEKVTGLVATTIDWIGEIKVYIN